MIPISFYEFVLVKIREKQVFYQDRIVTGNLNHEEYKTLTGKLGGLLEAEDEIKEAYRAMFDNRIKEKI